MQDETLDKLMNAVERMPAFPRSVQQVLALAGDINCSPRELVDVIKRDPVFTLKILRLVNSPYFGLTREITSIHHASVYLGLNTLKNVALGLAAVGAIPGGNTSGMDMGGFWLHSLAVAAASRMLAGMLGVSREEMADYFAAGLLHDIGKVVIALYLPAEFRAIQELLREPGSSLCDAEHAVIGATHSEIGALLAEKWNLPEVLRNAILQHHIPDEGEGGQLVDCVFVANQISKKLAFGSGGDFAISPFPASVKKRFSLDMDGLLREMDDLAGEVEMARMFIQLGESH